MKWQGEQIEGLQDRAHQISPGQPVFEREWEGGEEWQCEWFQEWTSEETKLGSSELRRCRHLWEFSWEAEQVRREDALARELQQQWEQDASMKRLPLGAAINEPILVQVLLLQNQENAPHQFEAKKVVLLLGLRVHAHARTSWALCRLKGVLMGLWQAWKARSQSDTNCSSFWLSYEEAAILSELKCQHESPRLLMRSYLPLLYSTPQINQIGNRKLAISKTNILDSRCHLADWSLPSFFYHRNQCLP